MRLLLEPEVTLSDDGAKLGFSGSTLVTRLSGPAERARAVQGYASAMIDRIQEALERLLDNDEGREGEMGFHVRLDSEVQDALT